MQRRFYAPGPVSRLNHTGTLAALRVFAAHTAMAFVVIILLTLTLPLSKHFCQAMKV